MHSLSHSLLVEGCKGNASCAAIRISSDGKAVYVSNRFQDSIAVFAVEGGTLKLLQHQSTLGKTPRDINIDPRYSHLLQMTYIRSGTLLLVANQDSSDITAFHIDKITHMLSPAVSTRQPSPASILFKVC